MTKKEMFDTIVVEYLSYMDSWYWFEKDKSNHDDNSKEYQKDVEYAKQYHNDAHVVESIARKLFGDVDLFEIWVNN